jgi:Fe-S-cluster containining protein
MGKEKESKMSYKDCAECGGQCCKGFGIPLMSSRFGIPLALYKNALETQPARYFLYHEGITLSQDLKLFFIDKSIKIKHMGSYLYVDSKCFMLNDQGQCSIYETRPDMCRNFTKETAHLYVVPKGCKYEDSAKHK